MNATNLTKEHELRHLDTHLQLQLAKILDIDDSVLSLLMGNIVKNLDDNDSELRFNSADINDIREFSEKHRKSAILVLLDEWSTMGKNRPRIKHLLNLLIKCQLFQAADFVAELINEPSKPERPSTGPSALVDISLPNEGIEEIVDHLNYPFSSITMKANRINNYAKSDIHSPNLNDLVINNNNSGGNNNSMKVAQSEIFNQDEKSDLIKFSKSQTSQSANESTSSTIQQSSNIPVFLMNDPPQSAEHLPVFLLQSAEQKQSAVFDDGIPDFSGLMNHTNEYSKDLSTDQSQSMTESSMSMTS